MGLFGLFYMLFCGGAAIGKEARDQFRGADSYIRSKEDESPFYIQGGKKYDINTRKQIFMHNMRTKPGYDSPTDYCMVDAKTLKIIKNFSQERRDLLEEKRLTYAKKNKRSVYRLGIRGECDKCRIAGDRFKDIETDEVYVIRSEREGRITYYMSVKTGKAIRYTDGYLKQIKDWEKNEKTKESLEYYRTFMKKQEKGFFERLNKEQEEYKKRNGKIDSRNHKNFDDYTEPWFEEDDKKWWGKE